MQLGKTPHAGIRKLDIDAQLPSCEVIINRQLYKLTDLVKGKIVLDIGCGYGQNRKSVEEAGGNWIGVEPFEGGGATVIADARDLPFENNYADVVVMDAVLEHIPEVEKAFSEVSRVLKPGGKFIGYLAFMECFHEISYSHLSFRGLEDYANAYGMKLTKISGGSRFGIDYHLAVLAYPIPFRFMRPAIAACIRSQIKFKSFFAAFYLKFFRNLDWKAAKEKAGKYYKLECLRMSQGFSFIISKPA